MSARFLQVSSAVLAALITGCATIVGHPDQTIPVASTPSDAAVVIVDESGAEVFNGTTPTTVKLKKSTDKYWGKKSYTASISKAGYKSESVPITASANGWYIAGNIVFGGLIGWFLVDPFNGNMYTLSPEKVEAGMLLGSTARQGKDKGISLLLVPDATAEADSLLVAIN